MAGVHTLLATIILLSSISCGLSAYLYVDGSVGIDVGKCDNKTVACKTLNYTFFVIEQNYNGEDHYNSIYVYSKFFGEQLIFPSIVAGVC